MLTEEQIKLLRKAIGSLPGEPAAGAKWILSIVLEDEPPDMPPVVEQIKAAEPTPEQKRIAQLEEMVTATRARAEAAEMEILRLKRG